LAKAVSFLCFPHKVAWSMACARYTRFGTQKEEQAKAICKALGETFERGRVVMGDVVKANGRANLRVTTFPRDGRGMLVDRNNALVRARQTDVDLLPDLKAAIARAAAEAKPYTKTGGNGVYERWHELPDAFHGIGKHRLADWVGTLLDRVELFMAMVDGSKLMKWLDVPDGPGGQRRGGLRHPSSEAVVICSAEPAVSIPGHYRPFPVSRFPTGNAGRVGTPNPGLARVSTVPGPNRSRIGVGTREPSNDATFPVPGVFSLEREGEHRECSPPAIPMAGRTWERCPG
jgi:hypothetical protein